jgi:hypothetical protein
MIPMVLLKSSHDGLGSTANDTRDAKETTTVNMVIRIASRRPSFVSFVSFVVQDPMMDGPPREDFCHSGSNLKEH